MHKLPSAFSFLRQKFGILKQLTVRNDNPTVSALKTLDKLKPVFCFGSIVRVISPMIRFTLVTAVPNAEKGISTCISNEGMKMENYR